jgi:hypothetical protein
VIHFAALPSAPRFIQHSPTANAATSPAPSTWCWRRATSARRGWSWLRLRPCTGRARELPKTQRPFSPHSPNWKRIASRIS